MATLPYSTFTLAIESEPASALTNTLKVVEWLLVVAVTVTVAPSTKPITEVPFITMSLP